VPFPEIYDIAVMRETHMYSMRGGTCSRPEHKCKLALAMSCVQTRARARESARDFTPEMHWVTKVSAYA